MITQHVAVDKQAAEKDLTASQKMTIGKIPVTADTFAGHLNISRQDIKWTSPGILQIVFEDFAAVYATATDNEACEDFAASVTNTAPVATWDAAGIYAATFDAAADSLIASNGLPDTLWVSPDVWGRLGGVQTDAGAPLFPGMNPGGVSGSPMGFSLVVDPHFPTGTMIQGPRRYAEWYEDVDGLMQVGEPDVLGQLVGYAGFGAFVNVLPAAYTKFTVARCGRHSLGWRRAVGFAFVTLDLATVRGYLQVPATLLTDEDLLRMLEAATADQSARCTIPDGGAPALDHGALASRTARGRR